MGSGQYESFIGGVTVARYLLIIENINGDRGELVIGEHSQNPTIVSWVLYPRDGNPERGKKVASLNKARKDFKKRFGRSPQTCKGGGSDNTWAVFRCSGCLTPIQDRRYSMADEKCRNQPPSTSSDGTNIIDCLYKPCVIDKSTFTPNGVCF